MARTVPVGKVPNVTKQFNAAANPRPAPKVPKLNHNLKPPTNLGPSLGPSSSGTPLRTPLKTTNAPARPTPAFNRAAAPTRNQSPARTRTR